MMEIRRDGLTGKLSIVVDGERMRRGYFSDTPATRSACPICPGNEAMTMPADLVLVKRGDMLVKQSDSEGEFVKDWVVRVFPEKFGIVNPLAPPSFGDPPHYSETAKGYHYVMAVTPDHDKRFHQIDVEQWVNVLASLQDEIRRLYLQKGVSYVAAFIDSGKEAGAVCSHPTIQIITMPCLPPVVEVESDAVKKSLADLATCPMCQLIGAESGGPRQVLSTDFHFAFTPWVSSHSYEFWIYPKRHQTSILKQSQREIKDLALIIRSTLGGLARVLGSTSFNLVFHSSPEKKLAKQIHWHIEVYSRSSVWSGLELGEGVYLNEVSPEVAAQRLGAAARKEFAELMGIT